MNSNLPEDFVDIPRHKAECALVDVDMEVLNTAFNNRFTPLATMARNMAAYLKRTRGVDTNNLLPGKRMANRAQVKNLPKSQITWVT